jgi:hypothetical protein
MPNDTNYRQNDPACRRKAGAHLRHLFAMRDRAAEACAGLDYSRRDLQERHVDASEIALAQENMLAAADALDELVDHVEDEISKESVP